MTRRSFSVIARLLRSGPAITRSMASLTTSSRPIFSLCLRAAKCGLVHEVCGSAPVKPGVMWRRLRQVHRAVKRAWLRVNAQDRLSRPASVQAVRSRGGQSSRDAAAPGRDVRAVVATMRMTAELSLSRPSLPAAGLVQGLLLARSSWPPPEAGSRAGVPRRRYRR